MSAFNAKGAPSVSDFLRDLHENPTAEPSHGGMYILNDQDMSMFTNSEFFDVETGQQTDYQPQPPKTDRDTRGSSSDHAGSTGSVIDDFNGMDFMAGDFGFQDFGQTYASPTLSNFPESLGHLQPIQPGPQSVYPVPQPHPQQNGHYPPPPRIGDKRKADAIIVAPEVAMDDNARLAAEEDKRRRNTAASARFRVKKKEREKALEKSAKEMTEKVTALEGRIQQLETENKWLKNIVLEKNGGNEDFLAKLLDEFGNRPASDLKRDEEVSNLKAPTSPEERDAGDSSG